MSIPREASKFHACNAALRRAAVLIWSLSDARLGNRRQAEALGAAVALRLDAQHEHVTLHPRRPWSDLAPRWLPWAARGFDPAFALELQAARPQLVIGCGRQAALGTRIARRLLGVSTRVVQILDPRLGRNAWDLLVLPQHDGVRGDFTLSSLGSLHAVDSHWLAAARGDFPTLGVLPRPRIGLLLGGPTVHCRWGADDLGHWLQRACQLAGAQGSVLAVAAPRTPTALREQLATHRANLALCWVGPGDGGNPYPGVLASSDLLIISPDSVNQLSEAIATEATVLLPEHPAARGRLARFHAALRASGRVEPLAASPAPGTRVPFRDTPAIAEALIDRLRLAPSAAG